MGKYGGSDTRNHGYGRSMAYAGKQALRDHFGGGHFGSQAAQEGRWEQFADWSKTDSAINDARNVTPEMVAEYATELAERGCAVATIQNHISAINVVMSVLRDEAGGWTKISPSELAGQRSTVRTESPSSLDRSIVAEAKDQLIALGNDRAAAALELGREFGVRMEEAAKADLNRWANEAAARGEVNVQDGTKGGRSEYRWVPVTEQGHSALAYALSVRPEGSRNLIAPTESYVQFRSVLNAARDTLKEAGIPGYHDTRAAYACERYQELTGHPAPVVAGERLAEKTADREAREVIAQELGHGRVDVVAAYVGSSR